MKLNPLTSLRFFAALGVLTEHFFQLISGSVNSAVLLAGEVAREGYIWVGFFFVLSGFIISFSYKASSVTKKGGPAEFLYKRFARLYPVHFATIIFVCYYYFNFTNIDSTKFLINSLLLQSWVPDPTSYWGFNSVSWSISCEAFFYVSFLFLVTLDNRRLIGLLCLMMFGISFAYLTMDPASKSASWLFYINPSFRLLEFVAGMVVFRLYSAYSDRVALSYGVATLLEVGSLLLLAGFLWYSLAMSVHPLLRYGIYYVVPMALIVGVFAFGKGALSKALSNSILVYLGEASFCLYMTHLMINGEMWNHFKPFVDVNDGFNIFMYWCLVAVVCVAASCLFYSAYEKPMNNFLRKLWKKKPIPEIPSIQSEKPA